MGTFINSKVQLDGIPIIENVPKSNITSQQKHVLVNRLQELNLRSLNEDLKYDE